MKRLFYTIMSLLCSNSAHADTPSSNRKIVVCIHGFLGSAWNLSFYKKHLVKDGWDVRGWNYSSRSATIEEHAEEFVKELNFIAHLYPKKPISFVAHSMGSLVLRSALNSPFCPQEAKTGKIVLLAPPNQGAMLAKQMADYSLGQFLLKDRSGKELSTCKDFNHLGSFPDTAKVLVIAGTLSWNPMLDGANDGAVKVVETFLTTPHVHEEIPIGHASILISKKAVKLTRQFLKSGESFSD